MSFRDLTLEALEQFLNQYLALDPNAAQQLASLQGRVIELELSGIGLRLFVIPGPRRLQILGRFEGQADCVLRGTPLTLARMSDKRTGQQQLFRGEVEIEGDTQLAHHFSNIIGNMDIDWEEQFSRLTGDAIAHQGAQALRQVGQWGRQSRATLNQDLQEYLLQEQQLLASREQVSRFCDDVDLLRDEFERLQARLQRLQISAK